MKKRTIFIRLLLGTVLGVTLSCAQNSDTSVRSNLDLSAKSNKRKAPIFAQNGVAIRGYDTVAYFTMNQPLKGSNDFIHQWKSVTWQFASADNRDLFATDPEKYAPQYGGYCAWAVKEGKTAPVDPNVWNIVNGKLYLNLNPNIQKRWQKDIPSYIAQADYHWPGVLEKRKNH